MSEKHSFVLGPVDAAFYFVERPETPMNVGAVSIFEGKIDYHHFLRLVDSRIHQAPLYQQRVIHAQFNLSPPRWVFDPDFNIHDHVTQVYLDPPGTEEQLRELVGRLVSTTLNREKPLWQIVFIEGLKDDRSAIFFKAHHCMVDGLSAVELFTILMDITPDVRPIRQKPVYDPPPLPSQAELLLDAVSKDLPHKWHILNKIGDDFAFLGSVLWDKEKRRKAFYGMANIINDNLTPIRKLGINGKNTGEQAVAWAEFSLSEVRAIKSKARGSVNDVMLTVLSRAIAHYLQDLGGITNQDFVRVLVPVNMRIESEDEGYGNRISVLPVDVKLTIQDPLEQLQQVIEYTRVMKQSSLSNTFDMVLTLPSLYPPAVQPAIWGLAPALFALIAHTWCTNVAGPQIPVYLMGHKMLHSYGYFPISPSMGMACVVMSYNQRISMNIVADAGIIPDVTQLREYLHQSYQELREAAKVQPMSPIEVDRVKLRPETDTNSADAKSNPPSKTRSTASAEQPKPEAASVATLEAEPESEDETSHLESSNPPSSNGKAHAHLADETEMPSGKPKLFSEAWAQAMRGAINASNAYFKASTKWEAGALAFIMKAAPAQGFATDSAVLLDLHKGRCREAHSVSPHQARTGAAFVIEGDYENWMKVLNGQAQPLPMLMQGKLKLRKGSMMRLIPFTQSAQELIHCAQKVS